jgi:pimeloyl-ACP methyl ester carboxylesterase
MQPIRVRNMRKQKLRLYSADKNVVPATHIKRGGTRLIVASHGITVERTEGGLYDQFIERLPPAYDAVLFDFRGHGKSSLSSIKTTITGELLDLMTVFNWARDQGYSTIDYIATSFGASIGLLAIDAYGLEFLRKVVFWNPVINYRNTFINSTVEWAKEFFDQKSIYELSVRQFTRISDEKFRISALMTQEMLVLHPEKVKWPTSLPLLILHGDSDTMVPVKDAEHYASENGVKIKVLKGVDHGFEHLTDEAIHFTVSWLRDETA